MTIEEALDAIELFADFPEFGDWLSEQLWNGASQGASWQEWLDNQAFSVAEEAGEFIGEYRRYKGFARRPGDREQMLSELSDVMISSMLMFRLLGEDPEQHIKTKLKKIVTRGYVNKDD